MRCDWLVFAFLVALGWAMPAPVTRRQQFGALVCIVLLVLMSLALFGVLPGLR